MIFHRLSSFELFSSRFAWFEAPKMPEIDDTRAPRVRENEEKSDKREREVEKVEKDEADKVVNHDVDEAKKDGEKAVDQAKAHLEYVRKPFDFQPTLNKLQAQMKPDAEGNVEPSDANRLAVDKYNAICFLRDSAADGITEQAKEFYTGWIAQQKSVRAVSGIISDLRVRRIIKPDLMCVHVRIRGEGRPNVLPPRVDKTPEQPSSNSKNAQELVKKGFSYDPTSGLVTFRNANFERTTTLGKVFAHDLFAHVITVNGKRAIRDAARRGEYYYAVSRNGKEIPGSRRAYLNKDTRVFVEKSGPTPKPVDGAFDR